MTELIQKFWLSVTCLLQKIENFLKPLLENLDPSLFQNITLGVLAIFIPFAIVFLTDILNSKKETRSKFEKMVLNDEVLGTKKIFWLAIVSIVFFAFFSGTDTPTSAKIVAILAALVLIFLFWKPFKKVLRFSEGYKPEFEIPFLKKLCFSKILFKFRNKGKAEKMVRAWGSFWSEKSEFNERDFTKIFISHIDDAIKHGKFELAVQLVQNYVGNIEQRDRFSIGYEILPKVLEWNEMFWNEQQLWLKGHEAEKRIQDFIPQKYFLTFRAWVLKIYKKTNSKREYFWNWNYFGGEFFPTIIKTLLKDGNSPYQLFSSFKKHVEESMEKLSKIEDKKSKQKYNRYITRLFTSFCPTFFNEINNAPSNYEVWEHNFPAEWKITIANIENDIPRVILHEFLQWSRDRIFKENDQGFDKDLTEVVNGIFPNVHSSFFTAFLMLFFSPEVKYAIEKDPNFYILGTSVSWTGSVEESEEERNERLAEMMKVKAESQREETVRIILNFFSHYWSKLKITLNDESKEEWEKADNKKREVMLRAARKEKLESIKDKIESDDIKEICKGNEQKELYRKEMLELIELLILEIEK